MLPSLTTTLFLAGAALPPTPSYYQAASPFLLHSGHRHTLFLPASALSTLRRWNRSFRVWRLSDYIPEIPRWYQYSPLQAPFAAIGDFNGDHVLDIVLHGRTRDREIVVCLVSAGSTYTIHQIHSGHLSQQSSVTAANTGLDLCLSQMPPGRFKNPTDNTTVRLSTDAFVLEYFERTAALYRYVHGRFEAIQIGD